MKFFSLVQRDGQSAQAFCNALQDAAENCDFGAAYSMNLKSRLIAGVRCDRIRETLLTQAKTFDYTATRALFLSLDAARQQSQALARAAHINVARQPAKQPRGCGNGASRSPNQRRAPKESTSSPGPDRPSSSANAKCWRCYRRHTPLHASPVRGNVLSATKWDMLPMRVRQQECITPQINLTPTQTRTTTGW